MAIINIKVIAQFDKEWLHHYNINYNIDKYSYNTLLVIFYTLLTAIAVTRIAVLNHIHRRTLWLLRFIISYTSLETS